MSDLMDRKRQLYAALRTQLDERFAAAEEAGVDAEVFADTDAIASAMVAALPAGNVYDQVGGPFYDTPGLVNWLAISKQALAKRVAAGTLIGCQLADARSSWVYPVWQFTPEGQVAGMIFGTDVDVADTGYALTGTQLREVIGDVERLTDPVDTQTCAV